MTVSISVVGLDAAVDDFPGGLVHLGCLGVLRVVRVVSPVPVTPVVMVIVGSPERRRDFLSSPNTQTHQVVILYGIKRKMYN